jgi:hypothetical protein
MSGGWTFARRFWGSRSAVVCLFVCFTRPGYGLQLGGMDVLIDMAGYNL